MSRLNLQLTSTAWLSALPKGISKLVLLCFCNHANDASGLSWPSIARVARMCGMSERTVQGHVRALQRAGILRAQLRTGRPTKYAIDLSGLLPLEFAAAPVDNFADAPELEGLTPAESAPPPPQFLHQPPQISTSTPAESAPITVLTVKENIKEEGAPALPATPTAFDDVNAELIAQWDALRKTKRKGPATPAVLDDMTRSISGLAVNLEDVLRFCIAKKWASFDAAWLKPADIEALQQQARGPTKTYVPPVVKMASPEVRAAGMQRARLICQKLPAACAPAAPLALLDGIEIGASGPDWARRIVSRHQSGQRISHGVLKDACIALKITPAHLSAARLH